MIQYATIRAFQERYCKEEQLNLDFSEVYARSKEGYDEELNNFNVKPYTKNKMKKTFIQKILLLFLDSIKVFYILKDKVLKTKNYSKKMYIVENKLQPFFNKHGLYSFRLGYYDFKNSKVNNKCFYGTFESSKYFNDIKDILREEFTPIHDKLKHNKELYKKIESTESVCVTIRRGDFVTNDAVRKNLYICTPEYFEKAIQRIQKEIKNPTFFIFSDDIEWCRNNMNLPKNCYFEKGDDPVWEKLRMMYSCKHFIISNSTFSWWVQYLSRNNDKVVIAPNRWTNDSYKDKGELIDIYEDNWILIEPGDE